ncbi:MAG: hypothetical protein ACE5KV_08585 [Thermoplasmata archaeon]
MSWVRTHPDTPSRSIDEAKLTSMEKKRKTAMEMEKEKDAPPEESTEDEEEIDYGGMG